MADPAAVDVEQEDELLDYEDENEEEAAGAAGATPGQKDAGAMVASGKKGFLGIHSTGFKDFLLKTELLKAIVDCGFEHPSEVQNECIPQAMLGMDILCQAKSGMGKTAVFVLSTLQQLEPQDNTVSGIALCHTRELAFQICHEFERFRVYMKHIKVAPFFGGVNISQNKEQLKKNCPHIVVGTPGRIKQLAAEGALKLNKVRHFVLDECDKMLEKLDMRSDVQEIFKMTPHDKQVMMFSATLAKDVRPVCKKFMTDVRVFLGLLTIGVGCRLNYEIGMALLYLGCRCILRSSPISNTGTVVEQNVMSAIDWQLQCSG